MSLTSSLEQLPGITSRRQLAQALGIGVTTLHEVLTGQTGAGKQVLQRIAYHYPELDQELCAYLRAEEAHRLSQAEEVVQP